MHFCFLRLPQFGNTKGMQKAINVQKSIFKKCLISLFYSKNCRLRVRDSNSDCQSRRLFLVSDLSRPKEYSYVATPKTGPTT